MSETPKLEDAATATNESITNTPRKNVPPLDGRSVDEPSQQISKKSRGKRVIRVIQSVTIIVALMLSAYSFTIIDSLDDSSNSAEDDNPEILVRTEGREADHICSAGGADILIGNDENNNGILEEIEVTSTTRLCHGDNGLPGASGNNGVSGTSGINSMIATTVVENGHAFCLFGGLLITTGLDTNDNGELDTAEVINSEYVCNGVIGADGINGINGNSGHSALVERVAPPAYLCDSGFIINFGIDNGVDDAIADDGVMQESEIVESLKVCSEPLNYGLASDIFTGVSDGYSTMCSQFAWSTAKSLIITSGSNGLTGCELWASGGSSDSAELLLDINPGVGDSSPGLHLGFTAVTSGEDELWLFDADSGVNGRELWVSNLTTAGTLQLTGYSGDGILAQSVHTEWMGGLLFSDANFDFMWTDGVSMYNLFDAPFFALTEQIALDSVQNKLSAHSGTTFAVDELGIWFSGIHDDYGYEMHHLSNSGNLTTWDLNTFEDSSPGPILPMGNSAIVVADDGINGRQLVELLTTGNHNWLTSMTLQSNGNPPTSVGEHLGVNLLSNQVIFDAQITAVDPTVWSYDLLTGALIELSSIIVAPAQQVAPVITDGRIWFDCITGATAEELCVSDGTTDGTKVIHEFQPGMASAEIRGLKATDSHLLIIANGVDNGVDTGHCLWSLDVSNLETTIVYDPWSGTGNNSDAGFYGELFSSAEMVLFVADNGLNGHELHMWSPLSITDEWLIW